MLILRRKAGESIVIGDEIKITVIDINEGSIRLAIEAPKRITVLRSELLQAADANRDAAKQVAPQGPQSLLSLLPQGEGRQALFTGKGKGKSAVPEQGPSGAEAGGSTGEEASGIRKTDISPGSPQEKKDAPAENAEEFSERP